WVVGLQNPDGSLGVHPGHRDQGIWLTAPSAVVFHKYGLTGARDRALDFVTSLKSETVANDPNVRQDNTIVGWPWVRGTFGWVEPTAWSVIALDVCGLRGHARAVEGRRFLLDRQIASGGWNYGNPGLNDRELLPFWDTTGLALLALGGQPDVGRVRPSLDLLERNQGKIGSLCGLAWAALGLESYGRDSAEIGRRLSAVMNDQPDDRLNAAHFAAGLIALSGRKVFIS
ncbi:MAG: prenyltransferase/squalene oxidase repeat-containing protein, partial [Candidatus Aminicenantales bacterium]